VATGWLEADAILVMFLMLLIFVEKMTSHASG